MYQARKDAVKKYYNEVSDQPIDKPVTDSQACHRLIEKSKYVQARLEWCKDAEAWESLCEYWCSDKFFHKRGLGKLSRNKASPEEIAQNEGGSRNVLRTKNFMVSCIQFLGFIYQLRQIVKAHGFICKGRHLGLNAKQA